MKRGTAIITIALLIALILGSGCTNVSFGNVKASNFGSTPDQQKLIDCFIAKYGDPRTDTGGPRFLEPIVTTNVVNDMPVDNVQSFSKDTPKIFFWVFIDNFAKGDMLDMKLVYLTNGQTVVTTQQQAGGEYGAATGSVEKPESNWPVGKYSITFSGKGASGTVTFEITDAATKTIPPSCDLASSSGNAVPAPGSRGNPVGQADAGSLSKENLVGKAGTGSGSKEAQLGNRVGQVASDSASKEALAVPASGAKPGQDLPKQGVVGFQGRGTGVSAQNIAGTCGSDQTMKNGVCICSDPSLKACGADCINHLTDPNNCGDCGKACGAGQTCNGGRCECTVGGTTACGDKCINLNTDVNNCGTCGNVCPQNPYASLLGKSVCIGGVCSCPTSGVTLDDGSVVQYTMCSEGCTILQLDSQNCGVCGHICGTGYTCHDGSCRKE